MPKFCTKIISLFLIVILATGDLCAQIPFLSSPPRSITLIQDIHGHLEAQKFIHQFLIHSHDKTNKELIVGVEAAQGSLNFDPFHKKVSLETVKKVGEEFFNRGDIGAPEYLGLTHPDIKQVGVEAADLYRANVAAYRQASESIQDAKNQLEEIKEDLNRQKKKYFSPRLFQYDTIVEQYRHGFISMSDYISELVKFDDEPGLSIEIFMAAHELENEIDFKRVERERQQLLLELGDGLKELINKPSEQLHFEMLALAQQKGLNINSYKHLVRYAQYLRLADGISADELFKELKNLEDDIYSQLSRNEKPIVTELIHKSQLVYLIGKLIRFELTPGEWEEYKRRVHSTRYTVTKNDSMYYVQRTVHYFKEFYKLAEQRNHAIVDNLMKNNASVLVAGGFHTPGIQKLLKEKNIQSRVVRPTITQIDKYDTNHSLSIFAEEKTPLQRLFSKWKLFLAAPIAVGTTPLVKTPKSQIPKLILKHLKQYWNDSDWDPTDLIIMIAFMIQMVVPIPIIQLTMAKKNISNQQLIRKIKDIFHDGIRNWREERSQGKNVNPEDQTPLLEAFQSVFIPTVPQYSNPELAEVWPQISQEVFNDLTVDELTAMSQHLTGIVMSLIPDFPVTDESSQELKNQRNHLFQFLSWIFVTYDQMSLRFIRDNKADHLAALRNGIVSVLAGIRDERTLTEAIESIINNTFLFIPDETDDTHITTTEVFKHVIQYQDIHNRDVAYIIFSAVHSALLQALDRDLSRRQAVSHIFQFAQFGFIYGFPQWALKFTNSLLNKVPPSTFENNSFLFAVKDIHALAQAAVEHAVPQWLKETPQAEPVSEDISQQIKILVNDYTQAIIEVELNNSDPLNHSILTMWEWAASQPTSGPVVALADALSEQLFKFELNAPNLRKRIWNDLTLALRVFPKSTPENIQISINKGAFLFLYTYHLLGEKYTDSNVKANIDAAIQHAFADESHAEMLSGIQNWRDAREDDNWDIGNEGIEKVYAKFSSIVHYMNQRINQSIINGFELAFVASNLTKDEYTYRIQRDIKGAFIQTPGSTELIRRQALIVFNFYVQLRNRTKLRNNLEYYQLIRDKMRDVKNTDFTNMMKIRLDKWRKDGIHIRHTRYATYIPFTAISEYKKSIIESFETFIKNHELTDDEIRAMIRGDVVNAVLDNPVFENPDANKKIEYLRKLFDDLKENVDAQYHSLIDEGFLDGFEFLNNHIFILSLNSSFDGNEDRAKQWVNLANYIAGYQYKNNIPFEIQVNGRAKAFSTLDQSEIIKQIITISYPLESLRKAADNDFANYLLRANSLAWMKVAKEKPEHEKVISEALVNALTPPLVAELEKESSHVYPLLYAYRKLFMRHDFYHTFEQIVVDHIIESDFSPEQLQTRLVNELQNIVSNWDENISGDYLNILISIYKKVGDHTDTQTSMREAIVEGISTALNDLTEKQKIPQNALERLNQLIQTASELAGGWRLPKAALSIGRSLLPLFDINQSDNIRRAYESIGFGHGGMGDSEGAVLEGLGHALSIHYKQLNDQNYRIQDWVQFIEKAIRIVWVFWSIRLPHHGILYSQFISRFLNENPRIKNALPQEFKFQLSIFDKAARFFAEPENELTIFNELIEMRSQTTDQKTIESIQNIIEEVSLPLILNGKPVDRMKISDFIKPTGEEENANDQNIWLLRTASNLEEVQEIVNDFTFDTEIESLEEFQQAHLSAGYAFLRFNQFEESIKYFDRVIEVMPEDRAGNIYWGGKMRAQLAYMFLAVVHIKRGEASSQEHALTAIKSIFDYGLDDPSFGFMTSWFKSMGVGQEELIDFIDQNRMEFKKLYGFDDFYDSLTHTEHAHEIKSEDEQTWPGTQFLYNVHEYLKTALRESLIHHENNIHPDLTPTLSLITQEIRKITNVIANAGLMDNAIELIRLARQAYTAIVTKKVNEEFEQQRKEQGFSAKHKRETIPIEKTSVFDDSLIIIPLLAGDYLQAIENGIHLLSGNHEYAYNLLAHEFYIAINQIPKIVWKDQHTFKRIVDRAILTTKRDKWNDPIDVAITLSNLNLFAGKLKESDEQLEKAITIKGSPEPKANALIVKTLRVLTDIQKTVPTRIKEARTLLEQIKKIQGKRKKTDVITEISLNYVDSSGTPSAERASESYINLIESEIDDSDVMRDMFDMNMPVMLADMALVMGVENEKTQKIWTVFQKLDDWVSGYIVDDLYFARRLAQVQTPDEYDKLLAEFDAYHEKKEPPMSLLALHLMATHKRQEIALATSDDERISELKERSMALVIKMAEFYGDKISNAFVAQELTHDILFNKTLNKAFRETMNDIITQSSNEDWNQKQKAFERLLSVMARLGDKEYIFLFDKLMEDPKFSNILKRLDIDPSKGIIVQMESLLTPEDWKKRLELYIGLGPKRKKIDGMVSRANKNHKFENNELTSLVKEWDLRQKKVSDAKQRIHQALANIEKFKFKQAREALAKVNATVFEEKGTKELKKSFDRASDITAQLEAIWNLYQKNDESSDTQALELFRTLIEKYSFDRNIRRAYDHIETLIGSMKRLNEERPRLESIKALLESKLNTEIKDPRRDKFAKDLNGKIMTAQKAFDQLKAIWQTYDQTLRHVQGERTAGNMTSSTALLSKLESNWDAVLYHASEALKLNGENEALLKYLLGQAEELLKNGIHDRSAQVKKRIRRRLGPAHQRFDHAQDLAFIVYNGSLRSPQKEEAAELREKARPYEILRDLDSHALMLETKLEADRFKLELQEIEGIDIDPRHVSLHFRTNWEFDEFGRIFISEIWTEKEVEENGKVENKPDRRWKLGVDHIEERKIARSKNHLSVAAKKVMVKDPSQYQFTWHAEEGTSHRFYLTYIGYDEKRGLMFAMDRKTSDQFSEEYKDLMHLPASMQYVEDHGMATHLAALNSVRMNLNASLKRDDLIPKTDHPILDELFGLVIHGGDHNGSNPPFFDTKVASDPDQGDFVRQVMSPATKTAVLQGPPGSGKTRTNVEIVRQSVNSSKTTGNIAFILSQGNDALDNFALKLFGKSDNPDEPDLPPVRFIRAAARKLRVHDELKEKHEIRVTDLWGYIQDHYDSKGEKGFAYLATNNGLLLDKRAYTLISSYIRGTPMQQLERMVQVWHPELIEDNKYQEDTQTRTEINPVIIQEEGSKADLAETLVPILHLKPGKVILTGDHKQLPAFGFASELIDMMMELRKEFSFKPLSGYVLPLIYSVENNDRMKKSLLERAFTYSEAWGGVLIKMLRRVRRSHWLHIAPFNELTYGGQLIARDEDREEREDIFSDDYTIIDMSQKGVNGQMHHEREQVYDNSLRNFQEAGEAVRMVNYYLNNGFQPNDIAILAPYRSQVDLMHRVLIITGVLNDIAEGKDIDNELLTEAFELLGDHIEINQSLLDSPDHVKKLMKDILGPTGDKKRMIKELYEEIKNIYDLRFDGERLLSSEDVNPRYGSYLRDIIRARISPSERDKKLEEEFSIRKEYTGLLEPHSVDSYQGQESPAVIVSFVRSNRENRIGFLGMKKGRQRINVAISRQKQKIALIGDFDTLENRSRKGNEFSYFGRIIEIVMEQYHNANVPWKVLAEAPHTITIKFILMIGIFLGWSQNSDSVEAAEIPSAQSLNINTIDGPVSPLLKTPEPAEPNFTNPSVYLKAA